MPVEYRELSPAKLNLFLKIISKRDDGYHNLRSGMTLVNLCDEVTAKKNSKFKVDEIKNSIAGNLCRCTGYQPIIKAAKVVISYLLRYSTPCIYFFPVAAFFMFFKIWSFADSMPR